MKFFKAFGEFWYEFIIGDDWKIACAVVLAIGTTCALMLGTSLSDTALTITGALLVVVAFSISLVIDVKTHSK